MIDEWFQGGLALTIAGVHGLRPVEHPSLRGAPVSIAKGQATNYLLDDGASNRWFLKRFSSGKLPTRQYVDSVRGVIPKRPEFGAGWKRHVVENALVSADGGARPPSGLADWLDGTILAPKADGIQWSFWLDDQTTAGERLEVRRSVSSSLAWQIAALEACSISHRDLSGGNVLVAGSEVAVIDWDTMYHIDLPFQANTSLGSLGYIAPWATSDARMSWQPFADRFALAIMICEALTVGPGTKLRGDSSLFDQEELEASGRAPDRVLGPLRDIDPSLSDLFGAAWSAGRFDRCPSPVDWGETLGSSNIRGQMAELTELYASISAGNLATTLERLSRSSLESYLSESAADRVESLKRSEAQLAQAIETGDRSVLASLALAGLIDRSKLRESVALEVDQAVRAATALAHLESALASKEPGLVRSARRALYLAGGLVPPALVPAVAAATSSIGTVEMTERPSRPGPSTTAPPMTPFDIESIPPRRIHRETPESTRSEMVGHWTSGDWVTASASWFRLRALWPESVTESDVTIGNAARARWGAAMNEGDQL